MACCCDTIMHTLIHTLSDGGYAHLRRTLDKHTQYSVDTKKQTPVDGL